MKATLPLPRPCRLAHIGVVSAYPITPQSPIAEVLSEYTGDGRLDAKYIRVESEHTAMSVAIGAQLTGVRTGTATSSVGLALMFEMLGVAARDTSWMQLYAEDCQDVLDLCLIAYRAAENGDVLVPTMVCMDGFFLSHMSQAVYVPSQQDVDDFLPPYQAKNLKLDIADPMFVNNLIPSTEFMEMRYQQHTGFSNALPVLNTAMKEFETQFGRSHSPIAPYCCDDAEAILITLGSMSGSVKEMVDQYRAQGGNVGNLKIVSFRPFPEEDLVAAIPRSARVGGLDRSMSMGAPAGPVCNDVRSAISNQGLNVRVQGFVVGLGGRDVRPVAITSAFDRLLAGQYDKDLQWLDISNNAMTLRQYRATI